MNDSENLDDRLKESVRLLHAWGWMTEISTRPEEAVQVLSDEARFLVRLGPKHPERWRQIGKLIVAYNQLIEKNKGRCCQTESAT
ncbi:hypothetical protein [Devosia naphthalenivorans]|uniref:hypothetical protein n=1 Tax=Devosia naphthalenivorans TaxID=2082392 RepID=UPI000D33307A|nr:hypothetical protein [Devosia naphthalenivorans]